MFIPHTNAHELLSLFGFLDHLEHLLPADNPWNDPVIDFFDGLIAGICAAIVARPPNFQSGYWEQMSHEDQLIAEGESVLLQMLYSEVIQAYDKYRYDTYAEYLDLPTEGVKRAAQDNKIINAFAQVHANSSELHREGIPYVTVERARGILSWLHGVTSNIEPTTKQSRAFYVRVKDTGYVDTELPLVPRNHHIPPATKAALARLNKQYRDKIHPWFRTLSNSMAVIHWELHHSTHLNSLTGNAGAQRLLLVDDAIPIPTIESFLGWYHYCGVEFVEAESELQGPDGKRKFTHYLCFQNPHLPVTSEQRAGAGGGSADTIGDSNSSHSLPSRSGGHVRTESGRILHGQHQILSLYMTQEESVEAAQLTVTNSMLQRPASAMRGIIPRLPRRAKPMVYQIPFMTSSYDPWSNGDVGLESDWIDEYPISTTMRSLGKTGKIHFMFTDTTRGDLALKRWQLAMASAAQDYLRLMSNPRLARQTALTHLNHATCVKLADLIRAQPEILGSTKAGKKKAPRFKFDLQDLNLDM